MKISIFTTMTNPEERMDPWKEAINCYENYADEVVIVGDDFKEEFTWSDIGKMFTKGLQKATGDWVIWMDIDNIFHEKDFEKLTKSIYDNKSAPSIAFPKMQIFTPDRFAIKSIICRAFNKKDFPNITLNGGGDLCLPTLNGKLIKPGDVPKTKVPIWNYDTVFRTKELIGHDRARYARAWKREFGDIGDRGVETSEEAFIAWYEMIKKRYKKHIHKLDIGDHPKFIINKLSNLDDNQFGYDGFGMKDNIKPDFIDYLFGYKDKIIYL